MYNTMTKENTAAHNAPEGPNLSDRIRQTLEIQEKTMAILGKIMANLIGSVPGEHAGAGGVGCMMEAAELLRDNAGRILDDVSRLAQLI